MHIWYPVWSLFLVRMTRMRNRKIQKQGFALDARGKLLGFDGVHLSDSETLF